MQKSTTGTTYAVSILLLFHDYDNIVGFLATSSEPIAILNSSKSLTRVQDRYHHQSPFVQSPIRHFRLSLGCTFYSGCFIPQVSLGLHTLGVHPFVIHIHPPLIWPSSKEAREALPHQAASPSSLGNASSPRQGATQLQLTQRMLLIMKPAVENYGRMIDYFLWRDVKATYMALFATSFATVRSSYNTGAAAFSTPANE